MSVIAIGIAIERSIVYKNIQLTGFADGKTLELELTEKLTIGSNVPYIGLLGTVLGIIFTFYSMGTSGVMDSEKIMLVLLTIVLTTSTFIATGVIPVELPWVSKNQSEMLKTQTIEIDKTGNLFLEDKTYFIGGSKSIHKPP